MRVAWSSINDLLMFAGSGTNTVNVRATPEADRFTYLGGSGTDTIALDDGTSLPEIATLNGSAGTEDTISYASWTSPVAANLSSESRLFGAVLDGAQETPPVGTAATGRASLQFNTTTNAYGLVCDVRGIDLSDLTGAHIHTAAPGVAGPIKVDLGTSGWTRDGDGIVLRSTGAIPPADVAALVAGDAYINVHTKDHPTGEIRGQLTPGTAPGRSTGLAGDAPGDVLNFEHVTGGAENDLLLGGGGDETLAGGAGDDVLSGMEATDNPQGGAGDDFLTGGSGADMFAGGGGDDIVTWVPGEGSDVVEGEGGSDRLLFFGSGGNEIGAILPDGDGVDVLRDVGNINLDLATVEWVSMSMAGGVDSVSNTSTVSSVLNGGDGDDTLTGGDGADELYGGLGTDGLTGGDGGDLLRGEDDADTLNGGPGDDEAVVDAGTGPDSFAAGEGAGDLLTVIGTDGADSFTMSPAGGGHQVVLGASAVVTTDAAAELIRILAGKGSDVLDASGMPGAGPATILDGGEDVDDVRGGAAADVLTGGPGNDRITDAGGADEIFGGQDDDTIDASDGVTDTRIECDLGTDTVDADADDPVVECETVTRPAVPTPTPTAAPTAAPTIAPLPPTFGARTNVTVSAAKAALRLKRKTRSLKITVRNANAFPVAGRLELTTTLRGLTVVIGRARLTLPPNRSVTATLRLSKKLLAALRRTRRVRARATLEATDPRGVQRTIQQRLTLTRSR
jgi:Ca2+-binding RTX toxin-like protein